MPPKTQIIAPDLVIAQRCLRIARVASLAVSFVSLCVLVGWACKFLPLMTVLPGLVSMKPNTAICLCLGGLSLFLFIQSESGSDKRLRRVSTVLALTLGGIGALTLSEYATGRRFGIDELIFKDVTGSIVPGRMAPLTGLNFVCLGCALILLRSPRRVIWAHAFTGWIAFTSLLTSVGFFYGVPSLYEAGHFTAVALHTSIAFLALCTGVWCTGSRAGFMRVVTSTGMSGKLVRRFGLASIVLPFLIGWWRVLAVQSGWCSADMGVVIVAMMNATIFTLLVWIGSDTLHAAEQKEARAREGHRESDERLQRVVGQMTEGLVICDLDGQMLVWNRAALEMHGFTTLEEGTRRLPEFADIFKFYALDGRLLSLEEWPMQRILAGNQLRDFEVRVERPDQNWKRIFRFAGSTVRNPNETPLAFVTFTDVTQQKQAEALAGASADSLRQAHQDLEMRVLQRTSELAEANQGLEQQMMERAKAEEANQQIMDHSPDVICTFDAEGRFVNVSQACETLWGRRPVELIGRRSANLIHPDDLEKSLAASAAIIGGKTEREFENRYLHKDGSVVPIVWTARWSEAQQIMFCVGRDMTARQQMEAALVRAKEAAEAASRSKSEFLANMSHEIRTPMNGIIGMTELVLDTRLDRQQREYLEMAKLSADTLLGLINDILDFSKIEAGKLELESIDFNLRDCIGAMLKPLGLRADKKGLELTADVAANVPYHVMGDPMRLRQILINLIDNAIKFTRHGDVMLRVEVDPAGAGEYGLRFSVRDTGIGIPEAKQAVIFEAFAQADGTTTRTYGGTGLGLAIASRLVEQMHGRIWVTSIPGEGTAFHFTARFAPGQTPKAPLRQTYARELDGLDVLVADDNAVNRRILGEMLTNWQMKPVVVASGEAALAEMLRASAAGAPYPLVILDGLMPEMDGFTAAEKIRETADLSGATVMMLSSAMPAGAAARCTELGVASYLTKPVSQSDLLEAILTALSAETEAPSDMEAQRTDEVAGGLRILVAEDNLINRALASGMLEKRGHSLTHAANGREAVKMALNADFDLIFMDVQMPEMDGIEATRRIRQAEQASGRHTPIAAMTAHAMTGDRERFLDAGMDDYISKPLERGKLFALLERVSENRGLAGATGLTAAGSASTAPAISEHFRPAKVAFGRQELLHQLDGDVVLMRRMVALFHENTPSLLDDIRSSIDRREPVEIARSAHTLLSSLGVFGAAGAHRLTLEIEAKASSESYEGLVRIFNALAAEVFRVKSALAAL